MPTKKTSAEREINIGDCVTMRAADRSSLTFGTGGDVFKVVGRDGVALILEGPMDHHPKHRKQRTMGAHLFKKTTCPRENFSVHHATNKNKPKTAAQLNAEIAAVTESCDSFSPCRGNYACCIHAASTPGTMEYKIARRVTKGGHATKKPAEQIIEPLPHNREWHDRMVGQGAELVARYKGQDIHRYGIAYYVNGFYVGTSMRRAKEYVRETTQS